jgi:tetratricopeptide (TPR) repeat protein
MIKENVVVGIRQGIALNKAETENDEFMSAVSVYEEANRLRDAAQYEKAYQLYEQARLDLRGRLDIFVLYDMALARDFAGEAETATKLFEQCISAFEKFQEENPGDSRIPAWDIFLAGVREQLLLRSGADRDKQHYFSHVRATPWARQSFPLRIFIDGSAQAGFDGELIGFINKAVDSWMEHIVEAGCLYVLDAADADIAIGRAVNVSALSQAFGGQTSFEYDDDSETTVSHARIDIFSTAHSIDSCKDQAALLRFYSLILHEFGHALGLDGHSPYGDDLMYWKSARVELSPRDIVTVKMLYDKVR